MIIGQICLIIVIITLFDIGMNDYSLMIIWRRNFNDCEGDTKMQMFIQNTFVLFHTG